jgi:hypothetical protein
MDIFINSLDQELTYRLNLHCPPNFENLIENAITIEGALIKRGVIKLDKDHPSSSNNNNNKTRFWNQNRNVVNDFIVDSNNLHIRPSVFNLSGAPRTNQQGHGSQQGQNLKQENMEKQNNIDNCGNYNSNPGNPQTSNPSRNSFFSSRWNFTTLGQSLESTLKELLDNKVITLPL